MNKYVTGAFIKKLREERGLTQEQLANILFVSDKAVSKWETGKGYPDITLLEPLAKALCVSVCELLSGNDVTNQNRVANMKKLKVYVCPLCSNVLWSIGDAVVSCCGVELAPCECEENDTDHDVKIEKCEDEYFVEVSHEMSKTHYISFIMAVKDNGCEIVKLYPQGEAQAYFKISRTKKIYYYCNHHGLFCVDKLS